MRTRIVVALCVAAVMTACGTSDEEQVQQVVTDYNTALGDGNVDAACALIAEEYWSDKKIGCREFVEGRAPTGVTSAGILDVQINGDTATATGSTHGDFTLQKIDGDWKLTNLF